MTAKFDKFKEALIALCIEHDVKISANMDQDIVVVDRSSLALYDQSPDIVDETTEPPSISPQKKA
jgi:ABC-type dipeptide/oligopeptide/nickel transport system ATPase subunit